jgi:hypothetical protein
VTTPAEADAAYERRLRQLALPLSLLIAFAFAHSPFRMLGRTFLSMWVHELGHAVTAWLGGYLAFPGPWFTPISQSRSLPVTVVILGALGFGIYYCWQTERRGLAGALGFVALAALLMTFGLRPHQTRALVIFGGDAGCLVLGALGMATFFAPAGSVLHRTHLRWGFLVIGAFAFADAFTTWWDFKHSVEGVVFGENEGSGPSDPTRLVFDYGWSEARLIKRYLTTAYTCALALATAYGLGLRARD